MWCYKILCLGLPKNKEIGYFKVENATDMLVVDFTELKTFIGLLVCTAHFKSSHDHYLLQVAPKGICFVASWIKTDFQYWFSCYSLITQITWKNAEVCSCSPNLSDFWEFCKQLSGCVHCRELCMCWLAFGDTADSKSCYAKYGIKIMCLTDARNFHFHSGYIYVGKDSDGTVLWIDEQQLAKPT